MSKGSWPKGFLQAGRHVKLNPYHFRKDAKAQQGTHVRSAADGNCAEQHYSVWPAVAIVALGIAALLLLVKASLRAQRTLFGRVRSLMSGALCWRIVVHPWALFKHGAM